MVEPHLPVADSLHQSVVCGTQPILLHEYVLLLSLATQLAEVLHYVCARIQQILYLLA